MAREEKSDFQSSNLRWALNAKDVKFRDYIENSEKDIFLDNKVTS